MRVFFAWTEPNQLSTDLSFHLEMLINSLYPWFWWPDSQRNDSRASLLYLFYSSSVRSVSLRKDIDVTKTSCLRLHNQLTTQTAHDETPILSYYNPIIRLIRGDNSMVKWETESRHLDWLSAGHVLRHCVHSPQSASSGTYLLSDIMSLIYRTVQRKQA